VQTVEIKQCQTWYRVLTKTLNTGNGGMGSIKISNALWFTLYCYDTKAFENENIHQKLSLIRSQLQQC